MSVKRQATTELTHENWDQEDPEEHKEMGMFQIAPKEVIEKRVIRTAKRRSQLNTGDGSGEIKKNVFGGFGGFNKTKPSSFDFLANLVNKEPNDTEANKDATPTSSGFKINNPVSNNTGIFSLPVTTSSKTLFGSPVSQSQFGSTSTETSPISNLFSTTKSKPTASSSPFPISSKESTSDGPSHESLPKLTTEKSPSALPTSVFGIPTTTNMKSLFSTTTTNSTSFKNQNLFTSHSSTSSTTCAASTSEILDEKKIDENKDDKKIKYYSKIKGLNECVSDWIQKHVKETPLCILTPIFKDYEKHLKEIQSEYESIDVKKTVDEETNSTSLKPNESESQVKFGTAIVSKSEPTNKLVTSPLFTAQNTTSSTNSSTPFATGGFSFGTNNPAKATSSLFSVTNTTTVNGSTPFSFGTGKPFSFSSNTLQKPSDVTTKTTSDTNEDEDEPPKVEFTPIVEDNSVYDKRCKIFVKKDGDYADKGIGTLYIKKIEESGKYQLLVRANTNLGNVLINLVLASAIPFQRMGKNNVMMVCIPTPESKPPPTSVLIRVKTAEEADELLETLNKYKG